MFSPSRHQAAATNTLEMLRGSMIVPAVVFNQPAVRYMIRTKLKTGNVSHCLLNRAAKEKEVK